MRSCHFDVYTELLKYHANVLSFSFQLLIGTNKQSGDVILAAINKKGERST